MKLLSLHGLEFDATVDAEGVIRWTSNKSVPPIDILELNGIGGSQLEACRRARQVELDRAIGEYRAFREEHGYSFEEKAEMLHELGPDVVDVLTGKRVQL